MARITSKQAKEMNEAYAKVHQNLQERQRFNPDNYDLTKPMGGLSNKEYAALGYSERKGLERASKQHLQNNPDAYTKIEKPDGTSLEKGDKGFEKSVDQAKDTVTKSVNSSLGKGSSNNNQSTQSNNNQQSTQSNNNTQSSSAPIRKGGGSVKVDGKGLMNKLKADSGDKVQSGGGGQSTGGQKPQRGTPVNQLFGKGGSDGSPAPYTGGPNAAQRANAGTGQKPAAQGGGGQQQPVKTVGGQGNRQRPVKTGGIQAGKAIRGGLGRLGALAGKAVGAAKSAAGNVAGGIKQGAQAVAGGIKAGAKAVGGALANKGPIQGRQTGAQRRAQQTAARPQPTAQPVQAAPVAKPVPQAQPAKPAPQLSGAQRAQQMAKQRIAQGRNTVTGALKPKPAPQQAKPAPQAKRPGKGGITQSWQWDSYDPVFDDTVQFLVSEGHAKDKSEAISIMSESEFIDAFNQELNG